MMKDCRIIGIGIITGLMSLAMMSCSTQKNTWATRSFHQTKVKYNILYNGNIAYEEGLKAIRDANEDDYSRVLNLYPVSNHKAAEASASQMDKTIEKCRKCIKLHSIKSKPKRDPKRAKDPKYKLWLESEEFNAEMYRAWLRLGEAEFHKGDFLGAVSTFNYVARHYANDPNIVAQCQLWIARAYSEMGWQYEAEDILNRVQVDALSRKDARFYSAVKADILLHSGQYHAALPFVKIATPYEKRKIYRPRFAYVMGQLYEMEGDKDDAIHAYKSVIRMAPSNEMDFNARIRIAELGGKNSLRRLRTMSKQSKNKDRLDRIYGSMGNIYLLQGDTAKALEMYAKAITEATQAGSAKADILVRAGDIYYDRHDYVDAQPCYREAATILTAGDERYERIRQRSEVLDQLIVYYNQAQLQDSLQNLSLLSETEQRAVVDKIIAGLIAREKADSAQLAQNARDAARGDNLPRSVNTANMLGGGAQKGEWYFYNPQLLRQGAQEWRRRWGNRTLEDNWRRMNKQVTASMPEEDELLVELNDSLTMASDSAAPAPVARETDNHKPEYYLQQIPHSEQDLAASDSLWREAMVEMVYIYRDDLHDLTQAAETLRQLEERAEGHPSLLDIYYSYYLEALRTNDTDEAAVWRNKIIQHYPQSTQARIVSQPGYFARLQRMAQEQDSLYAQTYTAYTKGRYQQVKADKKYAETEFPLSPLMPRFLFLNAVAVARTEGQQAFTGELQDLVARYPESELGAMAKDMLAMLGQGMESKQGGSTGSLADKRGELSAPAADTVAAQQWSDDRKQPSVVLLRLPKMDDNALNELLYQVALFNFSQFLIRDFDLQKMPVLGEGCALRVSGFGEMDEAEWWIGLVRKDTGMQKALIGVEVQAVAEVNLPLVK